MADEVVLNMADGVGAFVSRATDPVVSNVSTPADFAAQYPTPLDTTEILALCEEISAIQAIPEIGTALKEHTWREMDVLAFTSGSNYLFFSDGACPEEYAHDGDNQTITLKNLGAKKSLTISDIMHSAAVASANWNGINMLVAGGAASSGMPGGSDMATFQRQAVANLKEKEVRLGMTLVLNGLDSMLIKGNTSTSSLQFSGIENYEANNSVTFQSATGTSTGTFSADSFDAWLGTLCAKPTHIFGHPSAIQGMLSGYFELGFQGSQVIQSTDGNRLIPGFNFAGFVNTGVGRLQCVADINFTKSAVNATTISTTLWALRMTHNGEPLVYRATQIPLAMKDLAPGCTAISFEIWTKTALIMKWACTHGKYATRFSTTQNMNGCSLVG